MLKGRQCSDHAAAVLRGVSHVRTCVCAVKLPGRRGLVGVARVLHLCRQVLPHSLLEEQQQDPPLATVHLYQHSPLLLTKVCSLPASVCIKQAAGLCRGNLQECLTTTVCCSLSEYCQIKRVHQSVNQERASSKCVLVSITEHNRKD
jgi:hypothetical protein